MADGVNEPTRLESIARRCDFCAWLVRFRSKSDSDQEPERPEWTKERNESRASENKMADLQE